MAAVLRDTRPCVGIRYSLTGPHSCRSRRHRRHYRYHYVCRSVCLPVGRSVDGSVGRSVCRSVCRSVGRAVSCAPFSISPRAPSRACGAICRRRRRAAATDTTNIYSTATTIGARTRPGSTPPPHLSLLHRAPEEEAPHSRVVARTRPTHPACPPFGHLGAWTVFGAFFLLFLLLLFIYLFVLLFLLFRVR